MVLQVILIIGIPIIILMTIFFLLWKIIPENNNYTNSTSNSNNYQKTKCSHCGYKFKATKDDAVSIDWDFTGPDYYKFICPKCGRNHFVDACNF